MDISGTISGEYSRWIRTFQPSSHQSQSVLCYPDGRLYISCWLILDAFCWGLLSVGLLGAGRVGFVWLSGKSSQQRTSFQSHHKHSNPTITFSGWRLAFGVIGGGSSCLPHNLFCSTLLYSIHFSLSVIICFKNEMFLLCLSRVLHAEIWSRFLFFTWLVWNPNIKAMNITKLVQMPFNSWFGYL